MSRKRRVTPIVASLTVLAPMVVRTGAAGAAGVTAAQATATLTTQTTPANTAASGTSVYDTATFTVAAGGPHADR